MTKKLYRSITIRALSTLLIGALVIAFPTNATKYMVMTIGLLFLIPGLVSIIAYFNSRKKIKANAKNADAPATPVDTKKKEHASYFPIVSVGSVLFGVILLSFPMAFKEALIYILGAFLIVAALAQAFNMYKLGKVYKVNFVPYFISALIGIAGIVVIMLNYKEMTLPDTVEPQPEAVAVPQLVFGIACVVYGISEVIYAIYFRKPELKSPSSADTGKETAQ